MLYDISRDRVPKLKNLKRLIDSLAEWKYNQLQLYTEHTFAYSKHKTVWENASPLTKDDIREIDSYCKKRCIELVPNQNSFGHMERWLKHEEYKHLAESPDGFIDQDGVPWNYSSTLSPAVPESLDFLSDLYNELLPNFSSNLFNIGGDEPWELGLGRSEQMSKEQGLERVYFDFLLKIQSVAEKKGKRVQIYGDIILKYPHLIKHLPKNTIIINWGYEAEHPFNFECQQIAQSGIPFYVGVGTSAWNSIGGRWSNAKKKYY